MGLISRISLNSTAAEIRAADAMMRAAVAQLVAADTWSGADARRFQSEWDELVSGRLRSAATKIEGVGLVDFSPL